MASDSKGYIPGLGSVHKIQEDEIETDIITASQLATGSVDASEIATDAVRAAEIQADAVGTSEIATDGVDAAEIAADAVRASEIQASAVGTSEVNDDTLTASDIAASAFTSSWFEVINPAQMMVTSNGTVAVTRNAQGDWSLNQTAGGAETTRVAVTAPRFRTTASTGLRLDTITWVYEIAVADATSVDVLCDQTSYVQATDPAVATHGGTIVDGSYDTAHDTATERADKDVTAGEHVATITLPTAAYNVTANRVVVSELTAVLANTGTLKVRSCLLGYTAIDEGT